MAATKGRGRPKKAAAGGDSAGRLLIISFSVYIEKGVFVESEN